jgi:light-regulated signal transduction histidine kinase (bacteriophytochrome)
LPEAIVEGVERLVRGAKADGPRLEALPQLVYSGPVADRGVFDVTAHTFDGRLLIEFEASQGQAPNASDVFGQVLPALRAPTDLPTFANELAQQIKETLGYDRVMIYRFDHDWHGWVFAEARDSNLEPFFGLHYPASDIPAQARRLFLINGVRQIISVDAHDATLVPPTNQGRRHVDMSYATGRGVSPINIEYLQNMGVKASLTMAIRQEGQLWGMVACHHYQGPKHLSFAERGTAEVLAHLAEMRVAELNAREEAFARDHAAERLRAIHKQLAQHTSLTESLSNCLEHLCALTDAEGVAVSWAGSPEKPVQVGPLGDRLTPRKSFDLWVQEVVGQAVRWPRTAIDAAEGLRTTMGDILFRERARLTVLNEELVARNRELDSFAHMASHDLREPLRAIAHYAQFIHEDMQEGKLEETASHVRALERLVQRMYNLIDGLLQFSRNA